MYREFIAYSMTAYWELKNKGKLPVLINPENLNVVEHWVSRYAYLEDLECVQAVCTRLLPKFDGGIQPVGNMTCYFKDFVFSEDTKWFEIASLLHSAVQKTLLLCHRHERYLMAYHSFVQDYADTLFLLYSFFVDKDIMANEFWQKEENTSMSHGVILHQLLQQAEQYDNLYKEYASLYRLSQESGTVRKLNAEQTMRMERLQRLENSFNRQI